MYSVNTKIDVLQMINTLNVNHKIRYLAIRLTTNNESDTQILAAITSRCTNIYNIVVSDHND